MFGFFRICKHFNSASKKMPEWILKKQKFKSKSEKLKVKLQSIDLIQTLHFNPIYPGGGGGGGRFCDKSKRLFELGS